MHRPRVLVVQDLPEAVRKMTREVGHEVPSNLGDAVSEAEQLAKSRDFGRLRRRVHLPRDLALDRVLDRAGGVRLDRIAPRWTAHHLGCDVHCEANTRLWRQHMSRMPSLFLDSLHLTARARH